MYVKCEVEIPKKLNKAQRDALKKFEGTLKEDNYEKAQGLLQAAERHVCIKHKVYQKERRFDWIFALFAPQSFHTD